MSEAELFVLRARLQGGIRNLARRGALKLTLPIGLCYTESDTIVLDPNGQVQATIGEVFHSFHHTGSASATVRHFRKHHLLFPRRVRCGPHQGEMVWGEIEHHDVLRVLHHPAYAGAYVYGRTRSAKTANGKVHIQDVPRCEWFALVKNAHVGYITIEQGEPPCQRLPGSGLDQAIGAILIERVTPEAVAITLAVQNELVSRAAQAQRLRQRPRGTRAIGSRSGAPSLLESRS